MPQISNLLMNFIILSALAIGLSVFFVGTAANFTTESENLQTFAEALDESFFLNDRLEEIQATFTAFDPADPLTWGNFVSTMIGVFSLIFVIPAQIQSALFFVSENIFLVPGWAVVVAELLLVSLVVLGAVSTINKSGI